MKYSKIWPPGSTTFLALPGVTIKSIAKTYTGYAPMVKGRILISEIVSYTQMKTIRCRSKLRDKFGRLTRKWGPEMSWSQSWKNKGATIVKVSIQVSLPSISPVRLKNVLDHKG